MTDTSLDGKIILVTGATSGIGAVTARELAIMGAEVLLVGRNEVKVHKTVEEILKISSTAKLVPFVADLSSIVEIKKLAETVRSRVDHLDVLLNNAGAFHITKQISVDGFEMTFALNHLNYFLLTRELTDLLRRGEKARIVNVSSSAHFGGHLDFSDLQGLKSFSGWKAYSNSKLMNVLHTYKLAQLLKGTNITANVLHPGFVATNFGKSNGGILRPFFALAHLGAISPEDGAKTSIYLASSDEVAGISGKYFDKCKTVKSSKESYDQSVADKLWDETERLLAASA